jgi:hypothetical protein
VDANNSMVCMFDFYHRIPCYLGVFLIRTISSRNFICVPIFSCSSPSHCRMHTTTSQLSSQQFCLVQFRQAEIIHGFFHTHSNELMFRNVQPRAAAIAAVQSSNVTKQKKLLSTRPSLNGISSSRNQVKGPDCTRARARARLL